MKIYSCIVSFGMLIVPCIPAATESSVINYLSHRGDSKVIVRETTSIGSSGLRLQVKVPEEADSSAERILMDFTVENISETRIYFSLSSPGSGSIDMTLGMTLDGFVLPLLYTDYGRRYYSGEPKAGIIGTHIPLPLDPGDSYTWEVDLQRIFTISPGAYNISLRVPEGATQRYEPDYSFTIEGIPIKIR